MHQLLPYSELTLEPHAKVKYRVVLPRPEKPRRVLILLHGVGSNETHVRHLASHQSSDTLVILTQGPIALGTEQYAWFRVKFTPEGPVIDEQETVQAREQLASFVKSIQTEFNVPATQTIIAGFSQGGIMSASLSLIHPELVRGFAILSGRILPEIYPHIAQASELSHLHAFIAHGQFDQTLVPLWAEKANDCLNTHQLTHLYKTYPMAHELSAQVIHDFKQWVEFCFARDIKPQTLE